MQIKDSDLAAILSLSPPNASWMRRVFSLLHDIEKQKAAGVSYSRMAEALGVEPAHFRVYLHRVRKRALKSKTADGGIPTTSSISVTSTAVIKPVAEPDLTTPEGRRAAQAARFNMNVLNDEE